MGQREAQLTSTPTPQMEVVILGDGDPRRMDGQLGGCCQVSPASKLPHLKLRAKNTFPKGTLGVVSQ